MHSKNLSVLDAAATRALLPAAPLVEAVAAAMRARRDGHLQAPERLSLSLPEGGRYLVMPAADDELAVTKLVTVHPHNPAAGLPALRGSVLVADARDGRPLLLLDGPTLTARRTAAVTALGLRVLSRRPVRCVALVGTGAQALEHARLLAELGEVAELLVVGRSEERSIAFAQHLAADSRDAAVSPALLDDALGRAEAVVTLTTAASPVLPDGLKEALLVIGVGAFRPHMAELPPALLRSRRIVVDALSSARHEAGDLLQAGVDWQRVTELVDHLDTALLPGPAPVLKTVGHAAWDLAAARVALSPSRH